MLQEIPKNLKPQNLIDVLSGEIINVKLLIVIVKCILSPVKYPISRP